MRPIDADDPKERVKRFYADNVEYFAESIDAQPTIEQERQTGEWNIIYHSEIYRYKCSVCKAVHRARYDFCPSCGAKMKG